MRVLDLFSGIGGFSLGLERAGMETVAFCEIEEFPRKVLAKHWPGVPIYEDVRNVSKARLESDGITGIDVITAGFPCQDVSTSGLKAGANGSRTGLWREAIRLSSEIRPRYLFMENVTGLLARGFGDILGELASIGFDAEWECIPAYAIGGYQRRDRVWCVAYPKGERQRPVFKKQGLLYQEIINCTRLAGNRRTFYAADAKRQLWETEPNICRVADELSGRMDRIAGLGNAVVPQIPELIGMAIMAAERENPLSGA